MGVCEPADVGAHLLRDHNRVHSNRIDEHADELTRKATLSLLLVTGYATGQGSPSDPSDRHVHAEIMARRYRRVKRAREVDERRANSEVDV